MIIENETQADWIETIKCFMESTKKIIDSTPPKYIMSPDGTNYKLEELFKALEEYKKNEIKSDQVKKVK